MQSNEDLYQILQVDPAATQEEIQAAYRRLAQQYHPDTNPSPQADDMMKKINHAYEALSDPLRRSEYDQSRASSSQVPDAGAESGLPSELDLSPEGSRLSDVAKTENLMRRLQKFGWVFAVILLGGIIAWLLIQFDRIEFGSTDPLPVGRTEKGDNLIIRLDDIERVKDVRYTGTDENHYLVRPQDDDNELVVLRLTVQNVEATQLLFTIDENAAELRGFGLDEKYRSLDVISRSVRVDEEADSSVDRFVPFLWNPPGQSTELKQSFQVAGWLVFELPEGTKLKELRWEAAGDVIYIKS